MSLRPRGNEGGHVVLLDVVLAQLDPPLGSTLREFDWMRRLRNDSAYPSPDRKVASASDVRDALPAAERMIASRRHPHRHTDEIRATRLRRLATVEQTFQALAIDATVAREYGRLAAAVVAADRKPRARAMDLLRAATASANEARLFTRNPSDLAGLEDLLEIIS